MKNYIILVTTVIGLLSAGITAHYNSHFTTSNATGLSNLSDREAWEFERLKDPATGKIPAHARQRELQYARYLLKRSSTEQTTLKFHRVGPYNVGGRTRALVVDVDNENRILAGSVSGGLWESLDKGASWHLLPTTKDVAGLTCLVQDKRPGKHNIWYYGTGEGAGASQSAASYMLGNGLYKSTDNGLTWQPLTETNSNTPASFDKYWDIVWRLALDPSTDTADIVYAATLGYIYRSDDGGETWQTALGTNSPYSYYTDVVVTDSGVVYATMSSDGGRKGIWRSADGIDWTEITPDSFPHSYGRIVIGLNPQNQNSLYVLGVTDGEGQPSVTWQGDTVWNTLWKYTYLRGNGNDSDGVWTNLSASIPNNSAATFDNFYAQGGYDLVVAVSPFDSNLVFIGGTNLYRSTDGFVSRNHTTQIGGYQIGSPFPDFQLYKNHHPDIHGLAFFPSDDKSMISFSDGGIHLTNDNTTTPVVWERLNNGYFTTQLYTINMDHHSTSNIKIAGFQDNANFFVNSTDTAAPWKMTLNGDGSYSYIASDHIYYQSIQSGKTFKMQINDTGKVEGFKRIDPIGATGQLFIHPFTVDVNDENIMYYPAGNVLWRNNTLNNLPLDNHWDSISTGWEKLYEDAHTSTVYTCVAVSQTPAHRLYFGSKNRYFYRMDNADSDNPTTTMIASNRFSGFMSDIAIHPYNADNILVVFSNYGVRSIFHSVDGGTSWERVGGNLDHSTNASGIAPSVRCAVILPLPTGTVYMVGTSTGLYYSKNLTGDTTEWHILGRNSIGFSIVDDLQYRTTDGLLLVGTHGNGAFSTHITSMEDIDGIKNLATLSKSISIFPNPAKKNVQINSQDAIRKLTVYTLSGQAVVIKTKPQKTLDISTLTNGVYVIKIELYNGQIYTQKIVKE